MVNEEAYYSAERGVTVYPVQMHNASQMAFNPNTGLIYVPISPSNTFSFTASEAFTPNPGNQNFGLARGGRGAGGAPLATPAPYGPVRRGADGNPIRGGILTAWDPVTQKERWFGLGGGQTDGGVLTTASNLVVQTTPQGRLLAYTADKGEKVLDARSHDSASAPILISSTTSNTSPLWPVRAHPEDVEVAGIAAEIAVPRRWNPRRLPRNAAMLRRPRRPRRPQPRRRLPKNRNCSCIPWTPRALSVD
jgi:hypothetical protein